VIVTEGAAAGLERCRRFLTAKAPEAAKRSGQAIERQFLLLETAPDIGRPLPEMPELRELVIERALAASDEPLALDDLKIIVMMVYWRMGASLDALVLDELCDDAGRRVAH